MSDLDPAQAAMAQLEREAAEAESEDWRGMAIRATSQAMVWRNERDAALADAHRLAAALVEAREREQRVRALHHPDVGGKFCHACQWYYPCNTLAAIDGRP
jgi:hypothetical protein